MVKEVKCGIRNVAMVWDGEVACMAEGLAQLSLDGGRVLEYWCWQTPERL